MNEIRKKDLGIFWSCDIDNADSHWGNNQMNVFLKTDVRESDIDWKGTVDINMNFRIGYDEQEIRLKEGIPLHNIQVLADDEKTLLKTIKQGLA